MFYIFEADYYFSKSQLHQSTFFESPEPNKKQTNKQKPTKQINKTTHLRNFIALHIYNIVLLYFLFFKLFIHMHNVPWLYLAPLLPSNSTQQLPTHLPPNIISSFIVFLITHWVQLELPINEWVWFIHWGYKQPNNSHSSEE